MKFKNKKLRALTLTEVMIFFVVSAILLMITVPNMTKKSANQVCTTGGYVLFDGTKDVKGDKSGVVQVECHGVDGNAGKRICSYLWRAPVNVVYVTSVGGGGGGSGAIVVDPMGIASTDCKELLDNDAITWDAASNNYFCKKDDDIRLRNVYSFCGGTKPVTVSDGTVGQMVFSNSLSRLSEEGTVSDSDIPKMISDEVQGYFTDSSIVSSLTATYVKAYNSDSFVDKTNHLCKTETKTGNRMEPCSINTDPRSVDFGKEQLGGVASCWTKIPAAPAGMLRTPNARIINGAGGMGGSYLFGANYSNSIHSGFIENDGGHIEPGLYMQNQAQPIFLKRGEVYRIVVGYGGKGGVTTDTDPASSMLSKVDYAIFTNDAVSNIIFDWNVSGEQGKMSCIIAPNQKFVDSNGHEKFCDQCYHYKLYPDRCIDIFARAEGGSGGAGFIGSPWVQADFNRMPPGPTNIGYKMSKNGGTRYKNAGSQRTYYTHPFLPDTPLSDISSSYMIDGEKNLDFPNFTNPETFVDMSQFFNVVNTDGRFLSAVRLIADKGYRPQALGMPGSVLNAGKGGPSLYGRDRAGAGGSGGYVNNAGEPVFGEDGRDGLVEIKWFTTCE